MATQLITPDPNITCTPGECLVYVRETFGIGPKYTTATASWEASPHQHVDQDFPDSMWVPVWFSMQDEPDGHVALRQPDGSIWSSSSPTATAPVHHASLMDLESYYGGRLTYRGWTDDVEGVLVLDDLAVPAQANTMTGAVPFPVPETMDSMYMLQHRIPFPGSLGHAGHRPGHPAIEHMRIGLEIDKRIAEQKRKHHPHS